MQNLIKHGLKTQFLNNVSKQLQTNPALFYFKFSTRTVFKDSIYALSTGFGKSAIAVIRISGNSAVEALKLTQPTPYSEQQFECKAEDFKIRQRYAHYKKFYNIFPKQAAHSQQQKVQMIDQGLLLWFKGPHSFTGEDMVEFQLHGSNAVKQIMLETLSQIPSFKQAEPVNTIHCLINANIQGEFTKRAYLNGKLDLVKAEGLNDLINAESEEQLKLSLKQLNGKHSQLYQDLRTKLIRMLAHAEAYIDFEADETNDLKPQLFVELGKETEILSQQIKRYLKDAQMTEVIREGFKIAILGPPNAGKSTLMNLLSKRRVAIVSDIPGTTRDLIRTNLNLFGYNVILSDTAGLRGETSDSIEQQGIAIAQEEAQKSHGLVFVLDIQDLEKINQGVFKIKKQQQIIEEQIKISMDKFAPIILINKVDLINENIKQCKILLGDQKLDALMVSFEQQLNLDQFYNKLEQLIKKQVQIVGMENEDSDNFIVTRQRHKELLNQTLNCLENFRGDDLLPDMAVEELRAAIHCIGRITGEIDVEDILDVLFREFCIGK